MPSFAQGTSVPADRSRYEIERMVRNYGADQVAYMEDNGRAMIGFRSHSRAVKFIIGLPTAKEFANHGGRRRTPEQAQGYADQEYRRRWRVLLLVIKAKLEAVKTGVSVFDQEFFGYMIVPGGQTVYEAMHEQVTKAIESNKPSVFNLEGPAAPTK